MSIETPLLQELATEARFSATSLSDVTKVDRSTVYRLWISPNWLREAQVATLQEIAKYVPGVSVAMERDALNERLRKLADRYTEGDLAFDETRTRQLLCDGVVTGQYLLTALEAAHAVLTGDEQTAIRQLRPLWGRRQSEALESSTPPTPTGKGPAWTSSNSSKPPNAWPNASCAPPQCVSSTP